MACATSLVSSDLFLGSEESARADTLFVSLLASCQLHRIEPWVYVRDLPYLLSSWPRRRVRALVELLARNGIARRRVAARRAFERP